MKMGKQEPEFLLYENRPNNKTVGHHKSCGDVRKNGGGDLVTGNWKEFETREEVEDAGHKTGRPFWWCKRCGGFSKK